MPKRKTLHVIYVTGLGDTRASGQKLAVSAWRVYGVRPHFFQMKWADGESWEAKFQRLLALIDDLHTQNRAVALVGVSAGAGVAINAFAARTKELAGVVLIAGKVNNPAGIGFRFSSTNPAFQPSANMVPGSLEKLTPVDRSRILSRYAIKDEMVPQRDSFVPSARNQQVATVGHALTIAAQITFGAWGLLRFLKQQVRQL